MFTSNDFAVFAAPTLSARMALIRQQLDPKFTQAAQSIVPVLQTPNQPIFAHIAQHRRRHKNPPPNTWVAFSTSRRGYKMLPHLALGFWDDRLFLWLSCLRESKPVPNGFSGITDVISTLPDSWLLASEHTAKATVPLTAASLAQTIERFETVKSAEFLVGWVYLASDPLWQTPDKLLLDIQQRVRTLAPVFARLVQNTAAVR